MKSLLTITACLFFVALQAQPADGAFGITLNILNPTYTDYVGKTSTGFRLGYTRFKSDKFGWGFDAAYNTLNDYVPRQTYEYPGGAITTDIFNYMYYFTLMLNGQYYYRPSGRLVPYAALGAGLSVTRYTLFYNVYQEGDEKVGWALRPEAGLVFRVREYSALGLKGAVSWEYAGNKSTLYNIDNFSGFTVQAGIVLFNN
ncbi:MAG: hypothetical protein KatS3mg032_2369 [Cyclobacteriaceae bacterium]|nr:MAG: hypothetical protein KatS3mg032_2369 [Cyclobacteriaceae bacterium]